MWNIVTDSSCDTMDFETTCNDITYASVPFVISSETREFIDDDTIDIPEMVAALQGSRPAKTACPSPAAWHSHFEKPGDSFAFTISAELSGSFSSACTARQMLLEEQPERKVAVFNSKATGPSLILLIRMATRLIEEGLTFEAIVERLNRLADEMKCVYALSSFDNLVRNGRMSRLTGFVAHKLGFWGIGVASPEGRIVIKSKVRGTARAIAQLVDDIKERLPNVQEVVISHCLNPETANELKAAVLATFKNVRVDVFPMRGLDSFYAEKNGLIMSYR